MTVTTEATPRTVDDIVGGLRDHVWTPIRAQKLDAALVLMQVEVEDFLRASQAPVGVVLSKSRELVLHRPSVVSLFEAD